MKKFLGVLVAVALCVCMIVPAAMAADADYLASLKDAISGAGADANLDDLSQALDGALQNVGLGADSSSGSSASGGLGDVLSGLSGMIDPDSFSAISDALGGIIGGSGDGSSSFDLSSLMDTISGAFSGMGFDLGSLTEGFDPGSFDFSSIISGITGGGSGNGSSSGSNGAMDTMSGIMDTLMSGLSSLGIDTSAIEGLLDNDIVNFFANMYIGLGEIVKPEEKTTAAPATTKPAVVTTKTPKTGDTSAVFVALGTLTVAAAAAFVCLKKKKD